MTPQPNETQVFSAVICIPGHPAADIHGRLAACVRTRKRVQALVAFESIGKGSHWCAWNIGMLCESLSVVEVTVTEGHYGQIFVCPLNLAYTAPEHYQKLDSGMAPIGTITKSVKDR